jgi:photosystem II stability/assembly factor-like uncharacterized protein
MSRTSVLSARAVTALLLAMSLPIAAQSPEAPAPASSAAASVPAEAPAPAAPMAIPPDDPSMLSSEIMPRASRSLLLDVTHTAAGFFVVGERGHVLSSSDGKTWTQQTVPTRSTLTSITTADGQLWAAGHDGLILHSADGGQTWTAQHRDPYQLQPQEDPADHDPQQGSPLLDILFTDANTGIAIGANSLMLMTNDGGVTWTAKQALPQAPAATAAAPVADAAGVFSQDQLTLGAETDPHFNAIARAGSGALVIVGERGTFVRSRDGGTTWQKAAFPYAGSMFGVLSWDGDHILAFGLRGNVYESDDLGDTWRKVDSGVNSSLIGGQALANGGAILVGSNGVVLIRKDKDSPFVLSNFQNAAGETPVLANAFEAGNGQFLLIGDKGVDLYQPK